MQYKKNFTFFLSSILLCLVFLVSSSFSACLVQPTSISIFSGSTNLGNNFKSGDSIYIKSNLDINPIKVEFNFINNSQSNCFNSGADIQMKLFSNGISSSSTLTNVSLSNNTIFNSVASFNFKIPNFIVTSPFTSSFSIKSLNNPVFQGSLNFKTDTTAPNLNIISTLPNKVLYKNNDFINISYSLEDLGSGLDYLQISGSSFGSKIINFNGSNNFFNLNLGFNITNSDTLIFRAYDKLGNSISKNISFDVDNTAPQIILNSNNFKFDKSYTFVGGIRKVKFSNIVLSDNSFVKGLKPTLTGNFSSFNSNANLYNATCNYDSISTNYICSFPDIIIDKLSTTTSINLILKAIDFAKNSADFSFPTSIFIDKTAPQISEFYLINSVGVKKLVSPFDNGSYIYLKFFDDSILQSKNLPAVTSNFDLLLIPALRNGSCSWDHTAGTGTCIWDVGNKISSYLDSKKTGGTFSVQIYDQYRNFAEKNFSFKIDSTYPKVNKTIFIETNTVKDGIIRSAEIVDFRITLDDINLKDGNNYYVYADFTRISSKVGTDIRKGSCSLHNSSSISLYDCNFFGIKVRNGYRKDFVLFNISDSAGNNFYYPFNITILKIGNESNNAFYVKDNNKYNPSPNGNLKLLNPINRNIILSPNANARAWFEGNLTLKTPTDNFRLVNYHFISCDFIGQTPLVVANGMGFYPTSPIFYQKPGDEIFALKIPLTHISNMAANNLNDATMACSISLLTRDNTTIYPPEIVNFTTKIGFYDLPRGDYLRANAIKINELIGKANFLGSWFDKTYKYYEYLKGACTIVTIGGGILNTVNELLNGIQYIAAGCDGATAGECTGIVKSMTEKSKNGLIEMLGKPGSFIQKACDAVTCKKGGLLGSFSDVLGKVPGLSDKMNVLSGATSKVTNSFCGKGEPIKINAGTPKNRGGDFSGPPPGLPS